MKKPFVILLLAAGLATAMYFACYHFATRETRGMLTSADGLEWLRTEFALNDEQTRLIAKLQADYEPRCVEMCARISKSAERLEKMLHESKTYTPEVEAAVREASQTQADCRAVTLAQAFAISSHMTPEQGARYRAMIGARVLPMPSPNTTLGHH